MHWGRAVRSAREARGVKQADLAKAIGRRQGYVSRMESSPHVLTSTIETVATALGATPVEIAVRAQKLAEAEGSDQ